MTPKQRELQRVRRDMLLLQYIERELMAEIAKECQHEFVEDWVWNNGVGEVCKECGSKRYSRQSGRWYT